MKSRLVLGICVWMSFCGSLRGCAEEEIYRGHSFNKELCREKFTLPEGACRIILIRHGETEWNVLGLGQGWTDIPLNEHGKSQADEIGKMLSEVEVSAIYSSVLSRAVETADRIAVHHPECSRFFDPTLRFYDKSEEVAQLPKAEKKAFIARQIQQAADVYLKEAAGYHVGQNIVMVTHGKVIKYIVQAVQNQERRVKIGNTAMVSLIATPDQLTLEE